MTQQDSLHSVGDQGFGKTISVVQYVFNLVKHYPNVVIVSNIILYNLPKDTKIIYYKTIDELFRLFEQVSNGYGGVIYIVDEIQTLFNNLLRRGCNVQTLEVISQQRKQRKHIIGTAQVFNRIDLVFREQMKNIIDCNCFGGILQYNRALVFDKLKNKEDEVIIKKRFIWFHTPLLYSSYDTYAVISAYRREFQTSMLSDEAYELFKKMLGGINNEQ